MPEQASETAGEASPTAAGEGLPPWVRKCQLEAVGDGLKRSLQLEIAGAELGGRVDARLAEMAPRVRLQGFRPGKVPATVVRQRFAPAARSEILEKLSSEAVQAAVAAQGLRVAGGLRMAEMTPKPLDASGAGTPEAPPEAPGEAPEPDWALKVEFEVYPEVAFMDFGKISLSRPRGRVSAAEVQERADQLRGMVAEWKDADRRPREGDLLQLDVEIRSPDGEVLQKGREQKIEMLGASLPGPLFQALGAASKGDSGETAIDLPADARAGEGAKAGDAPRLMVWHWKLLGVQERELLDWESEELGARLGLSAEGQEGGGAAAEGGDAEEAAGQGASAPDEGKETEEVAGRTQRERLLEMCRQGLEREAERLAERKFHDDLMQELLRRHDLEMPEVAVARELDAMRRQLGLPEGGEVPERLGQEAARRVRLGVLVAALADQRGLQPDEAWMRERMQADAQRQQDPQAFMRWATSSDDYLRSLESEATQRAVLEWLASAVQVEERELGLTELRSLAEGGVAGA